jgi:hypothetical protein
MNDPLNDIDGGLPRVSVFVAKLDGVTWQEQYLLADGTWVDCTDGRRNTEAGPFEAVSLDPGMELLVAYETPSGYRYAKATGGGVRPCLLEKTSGTGDGTSPVSYVYTLTDALDNAIIFEGVSPEHNRLASKAMPATMGLYYLDQSVSPAEPHLISTDEIPDGVTEHIKIVTDVYTSDTVLKRKVRTLKFAGGVLYDSGTETDETINEGELC